VTAEDQHDHENNAAYHREVPTNAPDFIRLSTEFRAFSVVTAPRRH
jgi:hypothetical protein